MRRVCVLGFALTFYIVYHTSEFGCWLFEYWSVMKILIVPFALKLIAGYNLDDWPCRLAYHELDTYLLRAYYQVLSRVLSNKHHNSTVLPESNSGFLEMEFWAVKKPVIDMRKVARGSSTLLWLLDDQNRILGGPLFTFAENNQIAAVMNQRLTQKYLYGIHPWNT